MLRFIISALAACTPYYAFAQSKVDSTKPIRLEYASKSWNKSSSQEDVGAILLRDTRTGKVAQVQLLENAPNSGIFVGYYSVTWGESEIVPELFLPPQDLMKSADIKKIESMIKQGTLLRKPYFAKSDSKNNFTLSVFDTKEQALAAFEDYRRLRTQVKSPITQSAFETQANAEIEKERERREQMSSSLESERQKLEAEEMQRQAGLKKQFDSFSEAEKQRLRNLAQQADAEGTKLFQQGKTAEAEAQYYKANQLDPYKPDYHYRYGIALHRNEKHLASQVMLGMATSKKSDLERDFYIALNYMKLNENEPALKSFKEIQAKGDKVWSPQAALYSGILEFQKESFDDAKKDFEYVLDNSTDPSMDKLAEAYIEQIANAIAFKKEQAKKFMITLGGGLIYDSNILSISNSQLDQPTDLAGYRWTYSGTFEYRPLYLANKEFSAIFNAGDMYSTDTKFQASTNFQNTDPLSFSLYLPYKHKGQAFKKGYQMTLSPGLERTHMNADGTGPREVILNSKVIKNEHMHVIRDDWFSNLTIEFRQDTSEMDTSASPQDNISANKWTFGTSQTFFQNEKRTEAWIGEFSWSRNSAQGMNSDYDRWDAAATYMTPWVWDMTLTSRLAYYHATYPRHLVGRGDKNTTVVLGLRKPITANFAASLAGTYTTNISTLDSSDYRKYMILTTFSWTTSL